MFEYILRQVLLGVLSKVARICIRWENGRGGKVDRILIGITGY